MTNLSKSLEKHHLKTHPSEKRATVYVLPTWYGFLFMLVLLAMLAGSVNYGSNLGFVLTFLLGGMTIVSMVHTCRNISRIDLLAIRARPVFAGSEAVFNSRLQSGKKPAFEVQLGFSDTHRKAERIPVERMMDLLIPMKAKKRGLMESGTLKISSRYPFGLFRAWKNIPGNGRCLVYPRPMPGRVESTGEATTSESAGGTTVMGVEDFMGLNAYQPGDSIQHISWKAFSRGQGLFTKQFAGRTGTFGILDWDEIMETDGEKKLSRLCGMVLRAHRDRITFGLKLPGRTIAPSLGDVHRRNCLKALALYRIHPNSNP